MRRYLYLSLLVAVGLFVIAGIAAATEPHPATQDVSAAFSANQVRSHSRTCTQGGNTFRITNAVWRGTSTSAEPRLAGNLVIATRTVVNETTGDGWASGTWRTTPASGQMKPGKGAATTLVGTAVRGDRQRQPSRRSRDRPYTPRLRAAPRQLVGHDRRQHAER